MTRLVIHAGFHKTGTTSVQSMIQENHAALAPYVRAYLKDDFEDLTTAARAFSAKPEAERLARTGAAAAEFFATLDAQDPRAILMSSEDLSGLLPGRRDIDQYDCVPLLMEQISAAASAQFGPSLDLSFYFSTRASEAWLRSVWWQNLRSIRLTEGLQSYARTLAAAAELADVVADVTRTVAPAHVTSCALEDSAPSAFGPLTPVLALLGLDRAPPAGLRVLQAQNQQPDIGLAEVFLALNRSGLPDKSVAETKRSLLRMAAQHGEGN